MAEQGRDIALQLGDGGDPTETFTAVAGLTTKTFSGANGTLDTTNDSSDGTRELLAGKYGQAYTITASGVAPDDSTFGSLRTNFANGSINNYRMIIPGSTSNGTYEGPFIITALEETGETDGAYTFSITLESAGAVTFT